MEILDKLFLFLDCCSQKARATKSQPEVPRVRTRIDILGDRGAESEVLRVQTLGSASGQAVFHPWG